MLAMSVIAEITSSSRIAPGQRKCVSAPPTTPARVSAAAVSSGAATKRAIASAGPYPRGLGAIQGILPGPGDSRSGTSPPPEELQNRHGKCEPEWLGL